MWWFKHINYGNLFGIIQSIVIITSFFLTSLCFYTYIHHERVARIYRFAETANEPIVINSDDDMDRFIRIPAKVEGKVLKRKSSSSEKRKNKRTGSVITAALPKVVLTGIPPEPLPAQLPTLGDLDVNIVTQLLKNAVGELQMVESEQKSLERGLSEDKECAGKIDSDLIEMDAEVNILKEQLRVLLGRRTRTRHLKGKQDVSAW